MADDSLSWRWRRCLVLSAVLLIVPLYLIGVGEEKSDRRSAATAAAVVNEEWKRPEWNHDEEDASWPLASFQSFCREEDDLGTISVLDVTEFGAIGDGVTEDTQAIRTALQAAAEVVQQQGSAPRRVVVHFPQDKSFVSAPLNLTSFVTLQVDGTLLAITNETDNFDEKWPMIPPLPTYQSSEDAGHIYLQYQAFLYAHNATEICVRGKGVIHGNGAWWWDVFQNHRSALKAGRPNLIQWVNCTNLELTGVTLQDSPFWTMHPVNCQQLWIHHMKIRAPLYAPNVDGLDPDSCTNVLIEYNDISCGDDHIAIKSGLCSDGRPTSHWTGNNCSTDSRFSSGILTTRNMVIRHNLFRTGMGIAFGSELSGGIERVHVYNNTIGLCESGSDSGEASCGWGYALHIKTTLTRGGFVRHVVFENNTIYNNTALFVLETDYQDAGDHGGPPDYPTTQLQDISLLGNRGLGSAVAVDFECTKYMVCHDIIAAHNVIVRGNGDNYHCHYVKSFRVWNNTPPGLQDCMSQSMNQSSTLLDSSVLRRPADELAVAAAE